jgi:CheY-like chemotaxis protein
MKGTRFILLVEDSDDDALLFDRVVSKADLGIQMRRVHNGQEGIDYLMGAGDFSDRKRFPLPHVIMLDLKMPICDGFDFLHWKRNQPSLACLPTIVMTSSRFDGDIRRSYELGAHSFTMKVNTTDSLSDRVNALRRWWFENAVLIPPSQSNMATKKLD